jgi:hypothetical protein
MSVGFGMMEKIPIYGTKVILPGYGLTCWEPQSYNLIIRGQMMKTW